VFTESLRLALSWQLEGERRLAKGSDGCGYVDIPEEMENAGSDWLALITGMEAQT
jgi:hypothetical protein